MARTALFSSSVLSSASSGHRLPSLQVTLAFVAACGGDRLYWERRWRTVSGTMAAEVPATRAAEPEPPVVRPAQLPVGPRGFPGHSHLDPQVGLSRSPLVISGPVGVGKSDFALRRAHALVAATPDGQLYADLDSSETASGEVALGNLLHALVPAEQVPDDLGRQIGLYRSLLARRRVLVLLENVRDERQVRPLLAETTHGALILVSRTPLLGLRDVRRLRIGVLQRSDSVALIEGLVGERASADREACERLAEACGDLPLALDVAARRLAARPELSLRDVVARCADPALVLDWLRIGDVSVRDRLASVYRRLSPPAMSVLRQLGRGAEDEVDVPGVASALGLGVLAVDELLEELVEVGLLRSTGRPGGRRTDPLLHAFAAEQAVSAPREGVRRACS
jgi:hypothetical protein